MELERLRRRWQPQTESELHEAYDLGMLEERNWCDLKREVDSTDGARKELARDLASFSVDGGTLVIGIDEKPPYGSPLHPVKLAGLPERVERIALGRIDPPLIVTCTTIKSSADPGTAGPDAQINLNEVKKLVTGNARLSEALRLTFPNQRFNLDFSFMFPVMKTARGAVLTSRGVNMPFDVPTEAATLDAEVCEDGALRFFHGGAVRGARVRKPEGEDARRPQLYLVHVIVLVRQCLAFVTELSRIAGYEGMWDLGVGITDTRDADGIASLRNAMPDRVHWDEDSYQRTTRASVT